MGVKHNQYTHVNILIKCLHTTLIIIIIIIIVNLTANVLSPLGSGYNACT
jgi:hypothetical protein